MDINNLWAEHLVHGNEDLSNERKWGIITAKANSLLEASNSTQLLDNGLPMSKRLEWQTYRDNLRSIQDDFATPDGVIFPIEPEE